MKTTITILAILASVTASGCWFGGTKESPQGGVERQDEEFNISVPTSCTLEQGSDTTVAISLNRGGYFKRDVTLDLSAEGIGISPTQILVKASDKPDVEVRIVAPKDAALGEYRVSVKGTPKTGKQTSTEFVVKVVPQ